MLLPYSLGLGGPIGGGQQFLSWIAVDDLLDCYVQCLLSQEWQGAFNAVAPEAVSQAQFNRTLGQVLRRPAILPLPAAMVRLLLGEMGEETLLANLNVRPQRALQLGHRFRFAKLEPALRFMLGKS
jgi:NAD dependent epimerase/dehydratase family enzyme